MAAITMKVITKKTDITCQTNTVNKKPSLNKNDSAIRKYSFKTHAKPRKIAYNGGTSKVAALTQRFNQRIQQDATILEKVKKNGISLKYGGHVYKIKPDPDFIPNKSLSKYDNEFILKESAKKRTNIKRKQSFSKLHEKQIIDSQSRNLKVKAVIETFEAIEKEKNCNTISTLQKPKIPLKSEKVLQYTKRNSNKNYMNNKEITSNKETDTFEIKTTIEHENIQEDEKCCDNVQTKQLPIRCTDNQPGLPLYITVTSSECKDLAGVEKKLDELSKTSNHIENTNGENHNTYQKFAKDIASELAFEKQLYLPLSLAINSPVYKLFEGFDEVTKKLEYFSKSTNDITIDIKENCTYQNMIIKDIKPNPSFLYRANHKNFLNNSVETKEFVETFNINLINKTQSLDETIFPILHFGQITTEKSIDTNLIQEKNNELFKNFNECEEFDNFYESIQTNVQSVCSNNNILQKSFLFQSVINNNKDKKLMDLPNVDETIENNIYQTVAEALNPKCSFESIDDSYGGYESLEDNSNENQVSKHIEIENEYEIYDPPEPPPRKTDYNISHSVDKKPNFNVTQELCSDVSSFISQDPSCIQFNEIASNQSILNDGESHCYESIINKNIFTPTDGISLTSNYYESITSLIRTRNLHHSDSFSTMSSDQNTNSLYGMILDPTEKLQNKVDYNNSDEWIDISDDEDVDKTNGKEKDRLCLVFERKKCNRSPVWSKRIRNKGIHNLLGDNSDHLYESLSASEYVNGTELHSSPARISDNTHLQNGDFDTCYSDEYNSFDDSDEEINKNDSGVDISEIISHKLPDPPQSNNQVYAFVKKLKISSISKSLSKKLRKNSTPSPSKMFPITNNNNNNYENTNLGIEVNSLNSSQCDELSQKSSLKKMSRKFEKNMISNENIESPSLKTGQSQHLNPSPVETVKDNNISNSENRTGNRNLKFGNNFKSKFRKSLSTPDSNLNCEPSSLNVKRSTFYITTDIESDKFEKVPESIDLNFSQTDTEPNNSLEKTSSIVKKLPRTRNSPELNRRKTTIGIRPNIPPPLPPVDKKIKNSKRSNTTSWYTECGVFKSQIPNMNGELLNEHRGDRDSGASWYTEAGLYQTSESSITSSSGSSGVSTGGEGGIGDDNSHSMFFNEPLYQMYSAAKVESLYNNMEDEDSTDGYEEIILNKKPIRPTALQLIGPKQGPSRTLWSEIPEVINSEILSTLTPNEIKIQEAKFEILTSEASYLKSLNLLKTHFIDNPAFRDAAILNTHDRKILFSHIMPVIRCSDRLLCDLESCWQHNIMLCDLNKIISRHAEKYFQVYISFCGHQAKMDRTLKRLKSSSPPFNQNLNTLETDAKVYGLNLHSFLMLPMQRITRLPLLIDAIYSKLKPEDNEYNDWKMTLAILTEIVCKCNEAANQSEQAYEIERISRQIEFPTNIRPIAISSKGEPFKNRRYLVRKGELVHIIWRGDDTKLTFGKKFMKSNIYAFLFIDLLVLTKKKNDNFYTVFDYCPRSMLTISSGDVIPQIPVKDMPHAGKNLILMTLLENHERKTVEMILSCSSISEQQRWLQAMSSLESENPNEKLYEQWDCPQVITKHKYSAMEPDLISLEPGDMVNVTRKMIDGWYYGERIRDGATGWFPGNYTEEVNSSHVRSRNLKQRHRLLTLTASYLESIKKK